MIIINPLVVVSTQALCTKQQRQQQANKQKKKENKKEKNFAEMLDKEMNR